MVHVGSTFSGISFINGYHGRSQDFSKGGGGGLHCVKQRVLAFSQPEYCRLFEQKTAYRGGLTGTPGPPPLATPLVIDKSHYPSVRI